MSWGKKIVFVYLLFVGGIIFLVIKSMNQRQDLVTKDYYEQELVYQDRLDEIKRTDSISHAVKIEYAGQAIRMQFADTFRVLNLSGNVWVYCPDDATKDLKKKFDLSTGELLLSLPYSGNGLRRVKVSWEAGGKSYYREKDLFIQ